MFLRIKTIITNSGVKPLFSCQKSIVKRMGQWSSAWFNIQMQGGYIQTQDAISKCKVFFAMNESKNARSMALIVKRKKALRFTIDLVSATRDCFRCGYTGNIQTEQMVERP